MEPKDIIEALNGMVFSGCEIADGSLAVTFVPQTPDPNGPVTKRLVIAGVEESDITVEEV